MIVFVDQQKENKMPRNMFSKRIEVLKVCVGESRTKTEYAKSCNINNIMKRYWRDKVLPISNIKPEYGDFLYDHDLRESLDIMKDAQESFNSLPAAVRRRFGNDPIEFLDFVDSANEEQLAEIGLVVQKPSASEADAGDDSLGSDSGQETEPSGE